MYGAEWSRNCGPRDMMWCGQETGRKTRAMMKSLNGPTGKGVLVTLDKDFGELAIVHERPHSGIIRLVNLASRQQAPICLKAIELHEDELRSGAIITAEQTRLRIRMVGNRED